MPIPPTGVHILCFQKLVQFTVDSDAFVRTLGLTSAFDELVTFVFGLGYEG